MRNIFIDTRNLSESTHFVLRYTQSEELYIVINPTLAICTPQLCTHYYLFPVVLYYNPLSSTSIRRFTHSVPRCTYTFPRCTRSIALYSFNYLSFAIHHPENCKHHYYLFLSIRTTFPATRYPSQVVRISSFAIRTQINSTHYYYPIPRFS